MAELKSKLSTTKIELQREISEVNGLQLDGRVIPTMDFSVVENEIAETTKILKEKIDEFTANNVVIENQFKEQGIDQDVGGLLQKLGQYQKEIDVAEERLIEYEGKVASVQVDIDQRTELVDKIEDDLTSQLETIEVSFKKILSGNESWDVEQKQLVAKLLGDINIDGDTVFDVDEFYAGLNPLLNGQKFRR